LLDARYPLSSLTRNLGSFDAVESRVYHSGLGIVHRYMLTVQEGVMTLSKAGRCRELARLVGIPLMEAEVAEVAERFESLMRELERLTQLDLAHVQPVLVFPEEEAQP
jgi:hypothetical protein